MGTTTIRVRRATRDKLARLAAEQGLSTPEFLGELVDRAENDQLLAEHAGAYEALRSKDPGLLREIEREDMVWERSRLAEPPEQS